MSKQTERARALMDGYREAFRRIREAGKLAMPSDDDIESAIAGCFSSRDGSWRKTAPGGQGAADVLWRLMKFHRSGGSLYGWPWLCDRTMVDQYDTVVQVMLLVSGRESSAVNAWQRALYG